MFQYEKVLDQEPLISSDGENDGSSPRRPKRRSIAARAATVSGIALPWVLLIIMACWILLKDAQRGPERVCYPQMTYSPAQEAVEYEARKFRLGFGDDLTEFQGPPSPDLDRTWNEMYEMGFFSLLSQSEAAQLPNKTILMPHDHERRYVVGLDVFHQLHCLNSLRKALSPEYYGPGGPGADEAVPGMFEFAHLDHCIDSIRQSLTCTVDISALPWQWDVNAAGQGMNLARATVMHTCKKFDKIQAWAKARLAHLEIDEHYHEVNDPLDPTTWEHGWTPRA